MPQNMDKWIFRRANQTFRVFRLAAGRHMQAGDDHLQFRQHLVVEIQPVLQNIHLAPGQQPELAAPRGNFLIQPFDFQNLLAQPFRVQAIRLIGGFRVVGDRPVFQAQFLHVFRDFFQRVVAVAPI